MLYTHSSSCPACPGPAAHVLGIEHPAAVQAWGMERRPELPLAVSCFEQKHTGTFASLLHESSLWKTRKCPVRGGTHQIGEPTTKPGHVHGRRSWALFFKKTAHLQKEELLPLFFIFIALGPSFPQPLSKALL